MKKLIFLFLILFLWGCEKYEQPSSILQQMSGVKPWQLKNYTITITPTPNQSGTSIPDVGNFIKINTTNTENYVGLGEWKYIRNSGNYWIIQSDTSKLPPHRKYVIGDQWNFGNPDIYGLKIFDNLSNELGSCKVYENSSSSLFVYGNLLKFIENKTKFDSIPPYVDNGFVASTNSRGVSYATSLDLTTPEINAYIKDGSRIIGRFSYSINLHFTRN